MDQHQFTLGSALILLPTALFGASTDPSRSLSKWDAAAKNCRVIAHRVPSNSDLITASHRKPYPGRAFYDQ
jgi:hypothetical protein